MNFVSPVMRSTKPKLATTSGILYSSRASGGVVESEATYSGSTSPDSTLYGHLGDHHATDGLPPHPPELPLYNTNDQFLDGGELVTPCQGLVQRSMDFEGAFPFIQEFFKGNPLLTRQPQNTSEGGVPSVDGAYGFGGAVLNRNGKVRANSLEAYADDASSLSSSGGGGRGTASTTSVHNKKTQYHKTKLCPWHKEGKCFMGNVCNYAHSRDELKPKPDLSKTKLCPEVVKHKTCDRPGCRFAHDFVELRATSTFFKTRLCKFWQRGFCPAGPDCRHAHGKEDLRTDLLPQDLLRVDPEPQVAAPTTTWTATDLPTASPSFMSTTAPTPVESSPSGGLTPLYMQCAAELLSQSESESEVVQLLRRLAGEDLIPKGLLESTPPPPPPPPQLTGGST